jgi:hypothetical protein
MLQLTVFVLQQPGKQHKQHHEMDHGILTLNHLLKNAQTFTELKSFITVFYLIHTVHILIINT